MKTLVAEFLVIDVDLPLPSIERKAVETAQHSMSLAYSWNEPRFAAIKVTIQRGLPPAVYAFSFPLQPFTSAEPVFLFQLPQSKRAQPDHVIGYECLQ